LAAGADIAVAANSSPAAMTIDFMILSDPVYRGERRQWPHHPVFAIRSRCAALRIAFG
jgi:hypothetical protein